MSAKEGTFDDFTFLNRLGLTALGIWPLKEQPVGFTQKLFRKIHLPILLTFLFILLIPQWLDMYILWGNMDAFAETFVLNVFTLTAMIKLLCFVNAQNIFKEVILAMKNNWEYIMTKGNEKHKEALLEMADMARYYTKRYGLLMYGTALLYFMSPFIGMQKDDVRIRKYPFFGWYYFDRFSNWYYGLCYASQIISGLIVGTGNYSMDSVFLVAVYHCCAQLNVICTDTEKLGENVNNFHVELTAMIRKHQREIRLGKKLQTVFGGPSLQQLLVSCIIICIIGFKLIVSLNEGGYEFFIYIAFMFVALLQIFLYCRPGDELILKSQAIGHAAWASSWANCSDTRARRHLQLLIMRSQKPLAITAGKIYCLSLPNFTMILKTSASFLSLLRAMYVKDDQQM